jgi:hypothetical protein
MIYWVEVTLKNWKSYIVKWVREELMKKIESSNNDFIELYSIHENPWIPLSEVDDNLTNISINIHEIATLTNAKS